MEISVDVMNSALDKAIEVGMHFPQPPGIRLYCAPQFSSVLRALMNSAFQTSRKTGKVRLTFCTYNAGPNEFMAGVCNG